MYCNTLIYASNVLSILEGVEMITAANCALYFIKRGLDFPRDTFDGNMKLQKLLFFADMISLAETGNLLFADPVSAYKHGPVVESVREGYKYNHDAFVSDADTFDPATLSESDRHILDMAAEIYGPLSASALSNLTHEMPCWISAHDQYAESGNSVISPDDMIADIDHIRDLVSVTRELMDHPDSKEVINGISFYYDPEEVDMTDDLRDELVEYSKHADDTAFTITYCGDDMVIY